MKRHAQAGGLASDNFALLSARSAETGVPDDTGAGPIQRQVNSAVPPLVSSLELFTGCLGTILQFIDERIQDPDLGPSQAANEFHISKRYVHKVFAAVGMTFGTYVTLRRLDRVSKDLISESTQGEHIRSIAWRWGFRDITTFNRAFKRRFGCSPRAFCTRQGGWRRIP